MFIYMTNVVAQMRFSHFWRSIIFVFRRGTGMFVSVPKPALNNFRLCHI